MLSFYLSYYVNSSILTRNLIKYFSLKFHQSSNDYPIILLDYCNRLSFYSVSYIQIYKYNIALTIILNFRFVLNLHDSVINEFFDNFYEIDFVISKLFCCQLAIGSSLIEF
jgi:hypothetical protein